MTVCLSGRSLSPTPTWLGFKVPRCDWDCWMHANLHSVLINPSPRCQVSFHSKPGRYCPLWQSNMVDIVAEQKLWVLASRLLQSSDFIKAGFLWWHKRRNKVSKKWICAGVTDPLLSPSCEHQPSNHRLAMVTRARQACQALYFSTC